jgi:T3SS negative regulator,GrlR
MDRMEIEGLWSVRYDLPQLPPFDSEKSDLEEAGFFRLENGFAYGRDPWGHEYSGTYTLTDGVIRASATVLRYLPDAIAIFSGVGDEFQLEFEGEFNSPNYFSMRGQLLEDPAQEIVVNCSRIVP